MGDFKKFCIVVLFDGCIIPIFPIFVDRHTDPSHLQHTQSVHPSGSAQYCLLGQMLLWAVVRREGEKPHFCQSIRHSQCKDPPSSVQRPEPLVICFLFPAFFEISNVIIVSPFSIYKAGIIMSSFLPSL